MLRVLSIFLILFAIVSCRARTTSKPFGNDYGRGGRIIDCPNGQPKPGFPRYVATEVHEAMMVQYPDGTYSSDRLQLGPSNLGYIEKALYFNERLKKLDPVRYQKFKEWISAFKNEAKFVPDQYHISDDFDVAEVAPGCSDLQVIYRQPPILNSSDDTPPSSKKRYIIYEPYWNNLDDTHRAVLVLHEVVYRDAVQYQTEMAHRTARETRFFVRMILMDRWKDFDQKKYFQALETEDMNLQGYIEIIGLKILGSTLEYGENGKVIGGKIVPQDKWWDNQGKPQKDWRDHMGNIYKFGMTPGQDKAKVIIENENRITIEGTFLAWPDHEHEPSDYHWLKLSDTTSLERYSEEYENYKLVFDKDRRIIAGDTNDSYTLRMSKTWRYTAHGFEADANGIFTRVTKTFGTWGLNDLLPIYQGRIWVFGEPEDPSFERYDGDIDFETPADLDLYPNGIPKTVKVFQTGDNIRQLGGMGVYMHDRAGNKHLVNKGDTINIDQDGYLVP
ncbi:MAG: hypothetical protein AB7T49_08890 [Oligoflexales bacterium]